MMVDIRTYWRSITYGRKESVSGGRAMVSGGEILRKEVHGIAGEQLGCSRYVCVVVRESVWGYTEVVSIDQHSSRDAAGSLTRCGAIRSHRQVPPHR